MNLGISFHGASTPEIKITIDTTSVYVLCLSISDTQLSDLLLAYPERPSLRFDQASLNIFDVPETYVVGSDRAEVRRGFKAPIDLQDLIPTGLL